MDSKWLCVKYNMGVNVSGFDGDLHEGMMYTKRMHSKVRVWKEKDVEEWANQEVKKDIDEAV